MSNGAPIETYKLYQKGLNSGSYSLVKTWQDGDVLSHSLTVADDSLVPGSLLYFRYTSTNSVGESQQSTEVSFALAPFPSPPTSLVKVDSKSTLNSIYIEWDTVADSQVNVIGY